MKFKKGLAIVLAAVVACAALPACAKTETASSAASSSSTSSGEIKNDPWELTFMIPGAKDSTSTDNAIGQVLKDKFNVTINIVGYSGKYNDYCAQILAAHSYPEMMLFQNTSVLSNYIKADALMNMGDLAKQYAPNMLTFYKDQIPLWQMESDADGKMYCYCACSPNVQQTTGGSFFDMVVRNDIIKEQNYPKLLDEDSYISLLKTAMAAHPQTDGQPTIGMALAAGESWVLGDAMVEIYARGKYGEGSGLTKYDSASKKIIDLITDDNNWKEGMRFWNKMYREGILDKECFTDKDDTVQQKLSSGRALSSFYVTWEEADVNKNLKQAGKEQYSYITMPIMLKYMIDQKQDRVGTITDSYSYQTVAITKNSTNYAKIMQMVNWVCTDEGQALIGWGIKGKHYTVGSDGKKTPTADYLACLNGTGTDTHFNDGLINNLAYTFLGGSYGYDKNGQAYNIQIDTSVQDAGMDSYTKDVYSHYGWKSVVDPWKSNTAFKYTLVHSTDSSAKGNSDPQAEENVVGTKCLNYRNDNIAQLVMASSDADFESKWTAFVAGYKALDPNNVRIPAANAGLKTYQDALNAYKAEGLK